MNNNSVLQFRDVITSKDTECHGLRTMIMAGYDVRTDKNGIHYLGEEIIERQHNKVVAGGAINFLKLMFGATTELSTTTLNELMSIGLDGSVNPDAQPTVCLFNVGIGGCGASYADVKPTLDQENVVPNMIPFRIVDSPDQIIDKNKYWFHKILSENGKHAYYLKKFEATPSIHCLFKDGVDGNDGTKLSGNPANYTRTDGIETFVEIMLEITAEDLREYAALYDDPKYPRFNSIGLCMGKLGTTAEGEPEYKDVTQFSILSFSNEMLHFEKDLSIIYRVYLS